MVPTPDDATCTDDLLKAGEAPLDPSAPVGGLFDSRHADGVEAMDAAQAHMPVTAALLDELTRETDLHDVRIAVCLILEPKTAVLLRLLKAAGAVVGVFCEPESTDQRVADQLRREGITVQADAGWTAEQAHQGALRLLDEIRPQIIIDDGASFARLAALERPELLDNLVGVSEETTSGVRAFQAMQDAGALTFPVIAVNDSILASSGKRLRPMISLLTARALGTPNIDTLRYAAACELLHNATLMHDDVADESPERRGRPTVSALFGSSAAVLIGDFWLSRAVDLILMSEDHERVAGFFSKTLSDLAEGEMLQMEKAASADTDEDAYFSIIHNKTASLFETAGKAAAASVGASDGRFEAAKQFALCFGMAFQIKDDILDYVGDTRLGKPVGLDIREQKITLPLLGAMRSSGREAEIRAKIQAVHDHPEYCREIHSFVLENGGVEYASAKLDEYIGKACGALSVLPDSTARRYLEEIAHYNAFRQL